MAEPVISISNLTRRFGANTALNAVSLALPRGAVYGLVGANGAGKTTLIKHILGLLKAESGTVRIFGLDPVAEPVAVLSRIGYLSEENDLPGWMRVDELMRYSRAFYRNWDDALRRRAATSVRARAVRENQGHSSKGQKSRAGLVVALAYRPELLVLDEPSSGLDPIVRRDILGAVMRTIADEGRTVLFSSHLLDEVEQVADHVTMIRQGTIVMSAPLAEIKALAQRTIARRNLRVARRRADRRCDRPPLPSRGNSAIVIAGSSIALAAYLLALGLMKPLLLAPEHDRQVRSARRLCRLRRRAVRGDVHVS